MKYTIEHLWHGNIAPYENCGSDDPEVKKCILLMERNRNTLNEKLSKQQQVIFEKYLDCYREYMCLISMHAFIDGFCLASKLMAEALSEDS